MKWDNDKHLDTLLEENLSNYEENPSPMVWENVLRDIPPPPVKPSGFLYGSSFFVGIGTVILAGAAAIAWFLGYFDRASEKASASPLVYQTENHAIKPIAGSGASKTHSGLSPKTSSLSSSTNSSSTPLSVPASKLNHKRSSRNTQPKLTSSSPSLRINAKKVITDHYQPSGSLISGAINEPEESSAELNALKTITAEPVMLLKTEKTGLKYSLAASLGAPWLTNQLTWQDPLLNVQDNFTTPFVKNSRKTYKYYAPRGEFGISLYLQTDYLNGQGKEYIASRRTLAGVGALWNKNHFLFETGLVFCKENRDQQFKLAYNEFRGTYNKLDSIIFTVQNGHLTTTNVMSTDSVFAQEVKTSELTTSTSYTYLSLPVMAGVETQWSRFSCSIKTGFLLGLQLNKDESIPDSPENARVTSMNKLGPSTLRTNFQWVVRAGLTWYISDQYGIFAESGIQGYLSRPYKKGEAYTDRPVYYGIKAGIFRKF